MARKGKQDEKVQRRRGTYRAFSGDGTVIWECEDFEAGRTQIPAGISIAMKAARIVDDSGEVVHVWDPWGMFDPKD